MSNNDRGLIKAKNGSAGATLIQGGQATPVADPNGRAGWNYTKVPGAVFPDDKFNYFYWGGQYQSMKIKDLKSLFCVGNIDHFTGQTNEIFFFVIYTKMTGTDDAGSFYHSKHAYLVNPTNHVIQPGEKCLFYALEEPLKNFDGVRKIPMRDRVDTGTYDENSELLYATLHSDSGAVNMSCNVAHMGLDFFKNGFHAVERVVDVKCVT